MVRFVFLLEWLLRFFHLGSALRLQKFNRNRLCYVNDVSDEKISVFIHMCAYNGVATIREAVDSVLNQTHENWYLFISDDASSDDTWALIQELAGNDDRIEGLHLTQNIYSRGLSHRNVGRERFIEGSWDMYTVLDQDDVAERDWLANCLRLNWKGVSVLRMWNARFDSDLVVKRFEYPAAAQIMVPRRELAHLVYRRCHGMPADTDFLLRLEFRAVKQFKSVVVAPFVCQKMRFTGMNQSANTEEVTIGQWGFFWKYFWSA